MIEPKYADLYFGKSDSLNELTESRPDFIKSFVNINDIAGKLIRGERTLVLGPKGTGKSALGWYLEETSSRGADSPYMARVRDANTLPLADIPELKTGQKPGVQRTVTAWRFILLSNYLDVVLTDTESVLPEKREAARIVRLLREEGFMGDDSGRALLRSASQEIKIPVGEVRSIYQDLANSKLTLFSLLPFLERWANSARSSKRYLLLLDGLDSIFLNDEKYDESLASLVQASYNLNQSFRINGTKGSIVLLLRNDVFSRVSLSLPDAQKMRDDVGVELDWRILSGGTPERSPLVRLANLKAAQDLGVKEVDVLSYFPKDIELGGRGHQQPTWIPRLRYLLNLTRHTPRDFLRLLDYIREVDASGIFPRTRKTLTHEIIREGVLQYSTKYFTNAIRNEFAGYKGGPEVAEISLTTLRQLQKPVFTRSDFVKTALEHGAENPQQCDRLLRLLFYAGAIGNMVAGRNESYLQFYHRRDDTEVYLKQKLTLHNALISAWSLPFH